jgi:4,5:9,10-diseco-3-hydroxy-5,9,17-trioxoandrosta-1(10),2-diene-4-oate hydrolase
MYPAGCREVTVKFLTLRSGLRVRTLECGPARGEPVFFIHGWGCSIFSFRKNYGALARAGFRTLAVDLKGHGLSDKPLDPHEYTLDAMARHALDVLDALAVPQAAVVAHSMGSAIAIRLALQSPERVSRLALLAPVGFGVVTVMRLLKVLTPKVVTPILPYLARRWVVAVGLRAVYGRIGAPSARDVDEYWAPTQFPEFVPAMRELAHAFYWGPGQGDELRRIAVPTLLMFGTSDHVVQGGAAEKLVSALPHGRFERVEGGGHPIAEEVPTQVNAALLAHLADRMYAAQRIVT